MKTKNIITPSMEKILVNLGQFKYLTVSQMLRLDIMKGRRNLNRKLAELRQLSKPLVQNLSFSVHPVEGKLEHIHFLTPYGAEQLREYYGNRFPVRYPKSNSPVFGFDYFHRLAVIDFEISLRIFAEKNDLGIVFFTTYFDKVSTEKEKGYRAASAIMIDRTKYLIADAVFMMNTPYREDLYACEVFLDSDVARVLSSIRQHLNVLASGKFSEQYKIDYGSRLLCIFKHKNVMQKVMGKLYKDMDFKQAQKHILFKAADELDVEMFFDWKYCDGSEASLF
ncbi:replication-relaxation family protein [Chryseobacterium oryctis]|uniref:Replication-relaxation family protein n=1 Tax=Chryseobacterium oryctis TaxID=2952618 RepID=A0ABT3HIP7_9FLAO|nr:replication-relaxation family protein [Chryseobacterium oryctis]MCW3159665.1 replication-relaxation family protein [Chryseobacterium oryctis]